MITLLDAQTDTEIGQITQEQLNYLINDLEEESAEDTDYYINLDTLDMFAQQGVDPALIALLRKGLGDRQDMDIRWVKS
jgi:processive 1,2-diacylglycerol beta-glucosyltransferase